MERRAFLAASTAAALAVRVARRGLRHARAARGPASRPLVYELRRYRMHNGHDGVARFTAYAKDALVPALDRAGIAPVGAWNVALGADGPTLHLLIPHPDAASVVDARRAARRRRRVPEGGRVRARAAALGTRPTCAATPRCTPPVPTMPGIEKPPGAAAGQDRVFELRTYRSHSKAADRKKVEMFEPGGELAIFRRVGLATVFFGRDLVGAGLPSLTYMVVFADAAAREKAWAAFREDPEWLKLRDRPEYADASSRASPRRSCARRTTRRSRRPPVRSRRLPRGRWRFSSRSPAGAGDLEAVKSRGSLRVLAVDLKEPDEFFQFKGAPGFDREILEGFAALHRVRLEPVAIAAWDELVPALLADRGDLIAGRFTVTEERRRRIAFTRETFPTRNVVLTRKPTPPVTHASRRCGRCASAPSAARAWRRRWPRAGVPEANVDDGVRPGGLPAALAAGRVKAIVLGVENAIIAQRDDPQIEIGMFVGPPGSLAFGVRKEDAALLAALDAYIENLRRTATWNRLVLKYFGDECPRGAPQGAPGVAGAGRTGAYSGVQRSRGS